MAALRYDNEILQKHYAPISQEVERGLPRLLQSNWPFDLVTVVPHPVAWPDEPWVDLVNDAKDEFEVDDALQLSLRAGYRACIYIALLYRLTCCLFRSK